jgi:UDP-N-acetylglucosamine 4-epimerase
MKTAYEAAVEELKGERRRWVVTGAAGFIGSNLAETLLRLDQEVVGLDNFSLGKRQNLEEVRDLVGPERWSRFSFVEGDVRDLAACERACAKADYVLHQAALGSVPRSIEDPIRSHESNVSGHLNMLVAARDGGAKRFVYASSSSVYGDSPVLPKQEDRIGRPLSPYAATKLMDEIYADVAARVYGLATIGLRYFNVFGPRQDPEGAYAAVIPKWVASMIRKEPVYINGSGETSRDFCYVANAVQANLLAARAKGDAKSEVFNVAVNARTSLNQLFGMLREGLGRHYPYVKSLEPVHRDFRPGDVMHSQADIGKAQRLLGYEPTHSIEQGLDVALDWYREHVV